jgi:type IV pilus secretin PilQ/predicted competence protein
MKVKLPLFALSSFTAAVLAQSPAPAPIEPPVIPPVAPSPAAPGTPSAIPSPSAPTGTVPVVPAPIEPPIAVPSSPNVPGATPGLPGTLGVDPNAPPGLAPASSRVNEFQGDPIDLVLRTLAKQAKINLVISDKTTAAGGTVTMRLEDKSPREAIDIIVQSKGLVLDELNGVYFVKTQEEKAKEPTESASYTLSYAQAKDVVPLLQTQLQSGVAPQFDQRTNTIFYREVKSGLEKITAFLNEIDRPTQQVMIEARLVEVTANPRQNYGINWAGALLNQKITLQGSGLAQTITNNNAFGRSTGGTMVNESQVGPGSGTISAGDGTSVPNFNGTGNGFGAGVGTAQGNSTGLLQTAVNTVATAAGGFALDPTNLFNTVGGQFAILSAPQLSATVSLLNQDADAEFIANPRLVTANNQKAEIKISRAQPVPQLNFNEQTAQAVFSGFQDKEFGNTLTVTPIINKDQFVTLSVKPEISNKVADATFTFGGAVVTSPVIDKRTIESNVLIKSGDTLAIGGLLQDEQGKSSTKVPVLGDIPVIGYLFQEKINERRKRNLLVFVTPTIIRQGYGTGLENQVSGLTHSGEEYADPNGWRNNAKGALRLVPTSNRSISADYPKPGVPKAPAKTGYRVKATTRE